MVDLSCPKNNMSPTPPYENKLANKGFSLVSLVLFFHVVFGGVTSLYRGEELPQFILAY